MEDDDPSFTLLDSSWRCAPSPPCDVPGDCISRIPNTFGESPRRVLQKAASDSNFCLSPDQSDNRAWIHLA
jgi:hypothetical protein